MASKKKSKRRNKKFTMPVAVISGFLPGAWRLWSKKDSFSNLTNEAGRIYIAYDSWTGQFNPDSLKFGSLPILAGFVVHYIAQRLGVNRAIARAGVPFFRV